ncbi:hypothetical protein [Mesorhizobium sp. 2RAF21]|uniref:hypothetical protein n=1 Tax=Mesorhizobium sp. 2RAF21 TaxID=3232995 RepID=UPI003F95F64F
MEGAPGLIGLQQRNPSGQQRQPDGGDGLRHSPEYQDVLMPIPTTEMYIGAALADLHEHVRLVMWLATDEAARVALLEGEQSATYAASTGAAWLLIDRDTLRIERKNLSDLPERNYSGLLRNDILAQNARRGRAWKRADRSAAAVVKGLLQNDRHALRQLLDMAPLVEVAAYILANRIVEHIDLIRSTVRRNVSESGNHGLARRYWDYANMLGRATLVATTPGSRPWLTGAAKSVEWSTWTPSFSLVRERNPWLGAVAARTAAEVGAEVLPDYAAALRRARHPLMAADAIFGMTAIGLRDKTVAEHIVHLLDESLATRRQLNQVEHEIITPFRNQAADLLRRVDDDADRSSQSFTATSFHVDPLAQDASGAFALLSQLPAALEAPLSSFIRAAAMPDVLPGPKHASTMFTRAWGPEQQAFANPVLLH